MSSRNSPSPRRSTAPGSPYRRVERADNEDIFEIPAKHPSLDKLGKWRKATLALNATRRFRYTLRLKNGPRADIRVATQALRAVQQFKRSLRRADHEAPPPGFDIAKDKLVRMVADKQQEELRKAGGVVEVARKLHSDVENGIVDDAEEVRKRKDAYGENSYPVKTVRNFFVFVWEACQDKTLIILMVCAVLSLALGIKTEGIKEGWLDGASILFAVFLVILVTAASDYKQSLQFMSLNEEKRNIQLNVVRGGRRMKISIFDVVVGDIVPLSIGDQVPADGLLIGGHSLSIDESSMTGESDHVDVNQKNPFLKSGCKVADGYGTMLVTGVGLNTEWGLLMATISEDNQEETPLQVRLNGVATFIGKVGLSVAVVVFIVLLIRFFTGTTKDSEGRQMFQAGKTSAENAFNGVVKIFAIAVTIVVVAIPEGLPLAVTLTLAYSMRKMMADKALVRRLAACETMGSATTICSDKTGTLTMNQMSVVKVIVGFETKDPTDTKDIMNPVIQQLLIEGIAQNSTGSVFKPEGGGEHEVTGSPTEKAILTWALKLGMDFNTVRSKTTVLQVFTFNSEKKRGGVALRRETGEVHIHWKGAAEIVLELCDKWIDLNGTVRSMTTEDKCRFNELVEGMAASALRCIAIAHRTIDTELVPRTEEELHTWQFPEESLTLLAFVGIKDPCRPNVKEAVTLSQNAGVKVRMVTGDNLYTAKAIATECGILNPQQTREDEIIEGRDFRNLTEEERDRIALNITVMGRSSPNDKLLFVQSLRRLGHVVAVTGDGTNDAPALHEADIGLSMGIQGTEVAKESSDIIILDDDFASVVKVVRWGRSVYANIQKFIQFQLTVNAAALVINFVAAVSAGDVPLTAVQLLWVNLIMDTLGALALATEAPTDHLMQRPPVGRKEPLVTNIMWRNLLIQALYQIVVLLTLQFRGIEILKLHHLPPTKQTLVKNTLIFNAFVLCQVFNEFNSRKPDQKNIFHGLFKSPLFLGIISFTLVMQVMIIEFAGRVASTTKLTWQQWLICIVIGVLSWPLAVLVKMIPVPETPFSDYFNLERCKGSCCSAKQNENQTEMSSV